jgi:small subunit ribosomal protein S5
MRLAPRLAAALGALHGARTGTAGHHRSGILGSASALGGLKWSSLPGSDRGHIPRADGLHSLLSVLVRGFRAFPWGASRSAGANPIAITRMRGFQEAFRKQITVACEPCQFLKRGLVTETWSCVAKLDTAGLRSEHEQEVQRLSIFLQEVMSAYPQESKALVGIMRERVSATLYDAKKLVETLKAHLQTSGDALLSFEQLAQVYRTREALLDLSFGLRVAVPIEAYPPGMVPQPELEEKRRLTKRDKILAEQEAESALQERRYRELYGPVADARDNVQYENSDECPSGGYAQWYEDSSDPRTLLRGFHTVLLDMKRVAKVTEGSTRLSYRAAVCIGNGKGVGGYGDGKARTVQGAIRRATREARRNLIYVPLYEQRTIPHESTARFGRCLVYLWPLKSNTGLRMNYFYQCALDVIGVKDAGAKLHGSRNRINALKALFEALKQIHDPVDVAKSRGYRVVDLSSYIEGKLQTALLRP